MVIMVVWGGCIFVNFVRFYHQFSFSFCIAGCRWTKKTNAKTSQTFNLFFFFLEVSKELFVLYGLGRKTWIFFFSYCIYFKTNVAY